MDNVASSKQKSERFWEKTAIVAAISAAIAGTAYGVLGNFATDFIKDKYNEHLFPWIHKADIEAAKEGYRALVEADNANARKDTAAASREYQHAISKLTIAADANLPRANALLYRLYCSGRDGYVPRDPAKGIKYGVAAAALGDKYGGSQCSKLE